MTQRQRVEWQGWGDGPDPVQRPPGLAMQAVNWTSLEWGVLQPREGLERLAVITGAVRGVCGLALVWGGRYLVAAGTAVESMEL